MFKGGFAAETVQFVKGLEPNLLDNVLDLALTPGVAAGGGEDARGIFVKQRFEAGSVTFQDGGDQLRFGRFHQGRVMPIVCSNSRENLANWSVILAGCSPSLPSIWSPSSGLRRLNSKAATINDKLP